MLQQRHYLLISNIIMQCVTMQTYDIRMTKTDDVQLDTALTLKRWADEFGQQTIAQQSIMLFLGQTHIPSCLQYHDHCLVLTPVCLQITKY